jgi:SdpI/YfhL protein family
VNADPERLVLSAISAVSQIFLTALLITVNWRAATGRLRRNPRTGIRTPSTMRSDAAWVAGHRAALRQTPLCLLVLAGMLTALLVAVLRASTGVVNVVAVGGLFVFVPVALYMAFVAGRAAQSADASSGDPEPMHTDQLPNSGGRTVIHIWVALNGLLLAAVCVALWYCAARSAGNGIPPKTSLGFRDQHTLASTQGWYAAQRVGFHIAAICQTVVTATVFAVVAVAYLRRLNPMWSAIIATVGGLSVVACLLIAGHYADQAAISVNSSALQ